MMACLLCLAVLHPGRCLRGPGSELPSRRSRKAARLARRAEKKASSDSLVGAKQLPRA